MSHADHPAEFDPGCGWCQGMAQVRRDFPPNPDPLRPPDTDEEPWVYPIGVDDEDRGLWLGWVLLLLALVIGVVIGWLARG